MDQFRKRSPLEGQLGRMMRNMSLNRMVPMPTDLMPSAVDVYETEGEIVVYMDVSGIDPATLEVVAQESSVMVSGERKYPEIDNICCIHQIEIERGIFKRTLSLPKPVDINATSSTCKNGFLIINLPKLKNKGKIQITVT